MLVAGQAPAAVIERPKVELVDELGVNMSSGQVTHSLTAVKIGGPMGLNYTISIFANENWGGSYGFASNFSGAAKQVLLSSDIGYSPWYVMRVNDDVDSADFKVLVNGVVQNTFQNTPLPYTYEPVGDPRHTLDVVGNTLVWTKPDGTIVQFARGASNAGTGGILRKIIAPNGRTLDIGGGVTSNTGFQLSPVMELDHRPFNKTDNPNLIGVPPASSSADSGWSSANPKYMRAINNAIEYCQPAVPPATCPLTQSWPTATFDWPAGMPRTLFIGDSVVTVTRADGATTDFRYRAYDLAYNEFGQVADGYTPGREFSPRLVGVRPLGSTRESFIYDYKNLFSMSETPSGSYNNRLQTSGVIKSATHIQKQANYSMLQPASVGGNDYRNNAAGDANISAVYIQPKLIMGNPDMIGYVDTREGRITFESNHARNFASQFNRLSRPLEKYTYDTRGNLTKIEYQVGGSFVTYAEAEYPASCTSTTRKTCNQANWIADAKGNRTYYRYHPDSGELASVTAPADKNGHTAETRYDYTPLNAHYFDGSGSKITGSPIYMRTGERYCINSNYSSACEAGDEVVTQFEYNHDNLLMTGMTVTANGVTLRTCYQYDRFGNQIGKTPPNAARTTCN